jgi:hypothetical protein
MRTPTSVSVVRANLMNRSSPCNQPQTGVTTNRAMAETATITAMPGAAKAMPRRRSSEPRG